MNSTMTRGDEYQGQLVKGQAIHSILYGGRDGYIAGIKGEQRPDTIKQLSGGCVVMGGSADIVVNFEDGQNSTVPECIIRGVQWYIGPALPPDEQKNIDLSGEAERLARDEEAKIAAEKYAAEKAALPSQYPHLETVEAYSKRTGKEYADRVCGASNIRHELKKLWPKIKFSVKSDSFSGGDSIDVSWTDGPTEKQVDAVLGKYQQRGFDGMTDSSYSTDNPFNSSYGGASFVHGTRHESKALTIRAAATLGDTLTDADFDQWGSLTGDYERAQMIYRAARQMEG